jgi:HNH endonuclease
VFISLFGYLPNIVSLSDCTHPICNILASTERFPEDPTSILFWYINSNLIARLSFENATVASRSRADEQGKFKRLLKREYHQPEIGNLFDMATGTSLPHGSVVASHIFQHKWEKELSQFTSLTDIDDPCNGLLLYKPVEWAFDRAKICVEVKSGDKMTFRLLDEDLRDTLLADKACSLRDERGCGNKRLKEEENLRMTFGDLDEQPLKFPEGTVMRPSKRLLGLHAVAARKTAQVRNPLRRIEEVAYDTSDDETTKNAITVLQWRKEVALGGPVSVSHRPFGNTILTYHL